LRLTVVGSINLDFVATSPALPRPGETVTGATLARHPGGKGANQALAAQRLGAEVSLTGCVGDDEMSGAAMALLMAHGVELSGVETDIAEPTGVALIAVDREGENQIVVCAGANHRVTPEQLPARIDCPLIVQLELPIATVEAAVGRATEFVCVNLAPAAPVSDQLLRRADLLVVNETEAAFYGDLLHHGGGRVVVTEGAKGAVMYQRGVELARRRPGSGPWTRRGRATPSSGRSAWPCWKGWSRRRRCGSPARPGRWRRRGRGPSLPCRPGPRWKRSLRRRNLGRRGALIGSRPLFRRYPWGTPK